jgi:hypothetical protein
MNQFIIIKRDGKATKFLRHEGCLHFWTLDRSEAMEYTRLDVAQALASKMGGEVQSI